MEKSEYEIAIVLKDFNPYNPKEDMHGFKIYIIAAIIGNDTKEYNSTVN